VPQDEVEFKYLLTEEQFELLCQALGTPERTRELTNRYFTVEGGSERRDWVLRLRLQGGQRELTLKVGSRTSTGLFQSVEFNHKVHSSSPEDWEQTEPLREFRRRISEAPLEFQGESRTTRMVFAAPIEVGEKWELDRVVLPGGAGFFELEVETAVPEECDLENQRERLLLWLKERGIEPEPSEKTKYARFLSALQS